MKHRYVFVIVIVIALFTGITVAGHITYGYIDPQPYSSDPDLVNLIKQFNALEELRNYCFQHASDSPNPVQDLIDKGFLSEDITEKNCKEVKLAIDKIQPIIQKLRTPYEAYLVEQAMNNTKFNNCLSLDRSVIDCYDTYIGNRPAPR
jgi:hypothetical protein